MIGHVLVKTTTLCPGIIYRIDVRYFPDAMLTGVMKNTRKLVAISFIHVIVRL